jgi:Peptidase family M1 domain
MTRPRRVLSGALLPGISALLLLAGCTSFAETVAERSSAAERPACPAERATPDPDRPTVTLDFRLADDRRTVTGTETVVFTPDLATDRLVFRLVANGPDSAASGNRLTVESVRGSDVSGGRYEAAGAADPGGLYVVDLDRRLDAGESTEVTLDFGLRLGAGGFDRFGTADGLAWWGSGAPLLAWEPGVGWAEDPFVGLLAETATSPAADTTVTVSAPEQLTVLMTGAAAAPRATGDGRRTWTATEPAARDVAVAVGEFTTATRTTPDGVRITAGVPPGARLGADALAGRTAEAIGRLEEHLGPFPYRTLAVPLLPDFGGGIEYPGAILEATPDQAVLVHEVAHMWFYGMVGNSQFRDPWLDEAFATWAEALVDPGAAGRLAGALDQSGPVGGTMADYTGTGQYFGLVYGKGAAALLAAEQAAGAARFEAAIRCYADANAWSIATPADLAAVLTGLPRALAVLEKARAIDEADVPK